LAKRLALGGSAEVFLARRAGSSEVEPLAIKRILPQALGNTAAEQLFLDEARVLRDLRHPSLAQIRDAGRLDGTVFLALEYVHGATLSQALELQRELEDERVPWQVAVRIACCVAEALEYAHGATDVKGEPLRLLHRDVNPSNVMVGFEAGVKLLDFGVARAKSRVQATNSAVLRATRECAAPEQYRGQPEDVRVDVYGLSLTLHTLLSGSSPFERPTAREAIEAVLEEPPPPLQRRDVPRALEKLIRQGLAKEPDERPQSIAELRAGLETVLASAKAWAGLPEIAAWMRGVFPDAPGLPFRPVPGRDGQGSDAVTRSARGKT
jgi:serine/threonine-protein kinase